jgi:hypothetical protein
MQFKAVVHAVSLLLSLSLSGCALGASSDPGPGNPSYIDPLTGVMGSNSIDPTRPTHIILVGYSHGQGDQFLKAAAARARRYRELFPSRQVVFLADPDVAGHTDTELASSCGITVLSKTKDGELSVDELVATLRAYTSIQSIDVYAHSSPWSVGLQTGEARLSVWTPPGLLRSLRENFTSDAYVTLNGCNAGTELGPFLSSMWQVPVSGALTGSNFEQLHTDGQWYVNDDGQFPPGGWATKNEVSYELPRPCSKGACIRLRPQNAVYHGSWGNFGVGLGFYKFFCNYEGEEGDCERRMALSLLSFPSVVPLTKESACEQFEQVLFDYLCPASLTSRDACAKGIKKAWNDGTYLYSSFKGTPIVCDWRRCDVTMHCTMDENDQPVSGTCTSSTTPGGSFKTQVQEYEHFMRGFEILKAGN